MALDQPPLRLRCGVAVADLAGQVADGLPAADPDHQASCPYCQTALSELRTLWGDVRELARREVSMPEEVIQTVLARARTERPGPGGLPLRELVPRLLDHALLQGPRGDTQLAESVVAEIVRRAALAEPGVAGLCPDRRALVHDSGLSVVLERHVVRVVLRLRVRFGYSAPEVADSVRTRVIEALETLTGLHAQQVDIVIADITDER